MPGVYTVTQMNSYIKNMFRQDFVLSRISVKGEVSNCKYHTSGHIYFSLKDGQGVMSAIMFAGSAKNLEFRLENGMQVIVSGRIDVYERDGKYQLYANAIEADGQGDLYKQFEALKKSYEEMGYFSPEYKRPIPSFSRRIGIVTAATGAAVHDIMNISYRRNPYVALYLYPALVQGEQAAESIAEGIRTLDEKNLDVLIVGRGGGSMEDLWAFNEEPVIEAVFAAKTPVISAVGHETDFTITDFVADLRAPTPSAAAELAVCDISAIEAQIAAYEKALYTAAVRKISDSKNVLENYRLRLAVFNPVSRIEDGRQYTMQAEERTVSGACGKAASDGTACSTLKRCFPACKAGTGICVCIRRGRNENQKHRGCGGKVPDENLFKRRICKGTGIGGYAWQRHRRLNSHLKSSNRL